MSTDEFLISPDPKDPRLTERVEGADQDGNPVSTAQFVEGPLPHSLTNQRTL